MEVFAIRGHHRASLTYAWSHETDEGGRRYLAILGVDPMNSARDAVRASIAAGEGMMEPAALVALMAGVCWAVAGAVRWSGRALLQRLFVALAIFLILSFGGVVAGVRVRMSGEAHRGTSTPEWNRGFRDGIDHLLYGWYLLSILGVSVAILAWPRDSDRSN